MVPIEPCKAGDNLQGGQRINTLNLPFLFGKEGIWEGFRIWQVVFWLDEKFE